MTNNAGEAYTKNIAGRRGDVPPLSDTAPLAATDAVGDGVNVPEKGCTPASLGSFFFSYPNA